MLPIKFKLKASLFLSLAFLIISVVQPAAAQAPLRTADLYANIDSNVPRNLSTVSQGVMFGLFSSATCILGGIDPFQAEGKCIGVNSKTGALGYVTQKGGMAQTMGTLIGSTMIIPISSMDYAQYAFENFGITRPAYAQTSAGFGFNSLKPLLFVWSAFRNIAYLLFVLAFTIIGLAIMFRVKLDARTVMTIQNQIPKIILTLVFVTFSYAIAGFLIDIMYVLIYLVILTFNAIAPVHMRPNANLFSVVSSAFNTGANVFGGDIGKIIVGPVPYSAGQSGIFNIAGNISKGLGSTFTSLITDFISSTIGSAFSLLFAPFDGLKAVGNFFDKITFGFASGDNLGSARQVFENTIYAIFTTLIFLVVLIAILYSLFRTWFTLVKSFTYVLLDAMIGPLWITAGIFPGSKLGFISWIRHLMGHLSVFPMTFAVILLAKTIMNGLSTASSGTLFSPPLIGNALGGNIAVPAFIGLGFLISLPAILDRTKKAVGAMDFGLKDLGKSFGAGVGIPQTGIQRGIGMRQSAREAIMEKDPISGKYEWQSRGKLNSFLNILRK